MGLHFIFNGARQGETGIIATLQENNTQLQRIAAGFGWSLTEPGVEVMYRSPVDIYIDEWVDDLLRAVERTGATRVLIDSLGDLRLAAPDETRFREFVYSLVQRFSRQGVSTLMTLEMPDLFGSGRLSDGAISHLSDNVVLLRYVQEQASISRAISVIKTRASHHQPSTCRFEIGPDGITLAEPLAPEQLDAGSPEPGRSHLSPGPGPGAERTEASRDDLDGAAGGRRAQAQGAGALVPGTGRVHGAVHRLRRGGDQPGHLGRPRPGHPGSRPARRGR